ncbi:MAG TPA: response regulator [Flavisolibacter sp.]|jgi:CheY-like chemotaxis protein|nr:response regulator [Flavisolibacter sp.]
MKNRFTIFFAEDDIDDQDFLKEAILSIDPDIRLTIFSSGLKFIKGITQLDEASLPGLIILDYNIPEINGAEILEQLKGEERYAAIPKIVWSTSDSELYRENCLRHGASSYLVKPSSMSGIHEMAKQMLRFCTTA